MALVGTISGSNGTSNSAVTGTLLIANRSVGFPTMPSDAILFVSGVVNEKTVIACDIVVSGTTRMLSNLTGSNALITGDLVVNGKEEISGTLMVTGSITTSGSLRSILAAGSEGGEIFLASSPVSSSINTGITIDSYQNKLRIFETAGSARGGYYDITTLDGSVGTDLLRGDPLSQFLYRRTIIVQASANNSNDVSSFGTSTPFVQNGGGWSLGNTDAAIKYTTSNTVDTSARWRTPGLFLRVGHTGRFRFRIVTGASIVSETIIMGIQSDDAFTYNPAGRNAVTVVCDTSISSNWLLFTKDGTTANTVDTGVAVATSTSYSFDVKFTASTASLSVNGGAAVSTSSNMPSAGADLHFLCGIGNRSGGATRDFSFVRAVLECGS